MTADHATHAVFYLACPDCLVDYYRRKADPLTVDEEPWFLPVEAPRPRQRWALILGVSALVAIGLFLVGGTRV